MNVELFLLESLFNDIQLPNDFGLYFGLPIDSKIRTFKGLSIIFFNSQKNQICAMACEFIGFPFYLSISPGAPDGTGKIDAPVQYHPIGIELKNKYATASRKITFTWK